jgi:hypothetical protein
LERGFYIFEDKKIDLPSKDNIKLAFSTKYYKNFDIDSLEDFKKEFSSTKVFVGNKF